MKSSNEDLRKRGQFEQGDINRLLPLNNNELIALVNSKLPVERSVAIRLLSQRGNIRNTDFATLLLQRLTIEKCLYTKLEICNALEKGNAETATQMVNYLKCIGKNQYLRLPDKVSLKTSYPLPRDIIARSLGKMNTSILPVLIDVLYSGDINRIPEVLDGLGFMVFYHQDLVTPQLLRHIIKTMVTYSDEEVIIWKCVICLSAFPLMESIHILNDICETKSNETNSNETNSNETNCNKTKSSGIIRNEAKRSLDIIAGKI